MTDDSPSFQDAADSPLERLRARVGQHVGTSEWTQVTQEMVNLFADATGDHQYIHVDVERARQTPFGGTIAHGFLTLSLLAGHLARGLEPIFGLGGRMVVNYGLGRVRFLRPVPVGARVRARAELLAVDDGPEGQWVQVTLKQTVEIEGEQDKPALAAEVIFRTYF